MTNSAEDGNVIWQKEGGGRERRKREKKKGEKERERQRERGRHWHKDITIWRPATVQLAVSSYNSQHPWRISTSHIRALWIILWVPEGFDWHPPPTHTHTPSWAVIWSPCNSALQLCAQSSWGQSFHTHFKGCLARHPWIVKGLLFALFVLFCCLFLLLGLLQMTLMLQHPWRRRPATTGNGNNVNNTLGIYNTSFPKCLRCLHIYDYLHDIPMKWTKADSTWARI